MRFCDFAKQLKPLVGGKQNAGGFARSLFLKIVPVGEGEEQLLLISENSYRKYFNGDRGIEKPAKIALPLLDKEQFATWIDSFGPDTCDLIYQALSPYCDAMTSFNVGECCADLFVKILEDGAKQHRGGTGTAKRPSASEDVDGLVALTLEAGSRCPLCGKPLTRKKGGKTIPSGRVVALLQPDAMADYRVKREYEGAVANPPEPGSDEGRIALCQSCADQYEEAPTKEGYIRLVETKASLSAQRELDNAASSIDLVDEVSELLFNLANTLDYSGETELRYEALEVSKKMKKPGTMLSRDIEQLVVQYYNAIRLQVGEMQKAGEIDFDKVAQQVKLCYMALSDLSDSQEEIFQKLCGWIEMKTGATSHVASRALVAYFVQDCEVFDAVAE